MKEYGVALENGHIEMFTSRSAAEKFAKENNVSYIDIYDNDPESMDYLTITGDIKVEI